MGKQLEIIGTNLDTWKQVSVFYDSNMSLLDLSKSLYNHDNIELDVHSTLENYLDHEWIHDHILIIENTFEIMDLPLNVLLNDYYIYTLVNSYLRQYEA